MTARRLRPISRLISWVRPPIRPLTDSRSERVFVARGSIAYSLVTQPSPEPLRQRGTPWVTLAATRTRVCPNSTSTEPSAWPSQPRVILTSRSSSGRRPSARVVMVEEPRRRADRLAHRRLSGAPMLQTPPVTASEVGPEKCGVASVSTRSGSCHGGMWVSSTCPTPGPLPRRGGLRRRSGGRRPGGPGRPGTRPRPAAGRRPGRPRRGRARRARRRGRCRRRRPATRRPRPPR